MLRESVIYLDYFYFCPEGPGKDPYFYPKLKHGLHSGAGIHSNLLPRLTLGGIIIVL